MPTPPSDLTELPIEILERILLCLPGQDIIKIEMVNRHIRDLVRNSPTLQHRCELFAVGLIDNPCCPRDLAERRKLREEYTRKWTCKSDTVVESTKGLPPVQSVGWVYADYFGDGYVASRSIERNGRTFLRIPPVASQKPVEGWTIPPFAYDVFDYAVYPPGNVLAVAERGENFIRIHLLNLRDGSPYYPLPSDTIAWEIPPGIHVVNHRMAITGSRVMIFCSYRDKDLPIYEIVRRIFVWDQKTGDLVLDLSPADEKIFVTPETEVAFLDEFRMVVLPDPEVIKELIVFNTLIPQGDPGGLRRLGLPQRFHDRGTEMAAEIIVDHNRPLGTLNRDEPLIADPAQAVLVLEIPHDLDPHVFLVMRTQALVEQTLLTCTDSCVPWDEWRGDAVVMESQVVVVWVNHAGDWGVQTLDFSRRGRSSLPLWGDGSGEIEGTQFEDCCDRIFESRDGMDPRDLKSLGDGSLFWLGTLDEVYDPDVTLHVWELV